MADRGATAAAPGGPAVADAHRYLVDRFTDLQQVLLEATELDLPGPTIGPDDEDFYTAMVLAFADKVAEAVAEVDDLPEIEETLR